jgi:hypothetical protein
VKKIITALAVLGSVSIVTTASANPLAALENEMHELKMKSENISKVVNSNTLRAARKMCLVTAHHARKDGTIDAKLFSEVAAHCASGNIHGALRALGGTLHDDVVHSVHQIHGGITRHVHRWEHEALDVWHKIK